MPPIKHKDRRRHPRPAINSLVQVGWQDGQGTDRFSTGRCLEISEAGMRIEMAQPLALRTSVTFVIPEFQFRGSASVRHSTRTGSRYAIGLEFTGGLRWQTTAAQASSGLS